MYKWRLRSTEIRPYMQDLDTERVHTFAEEGNYFRTKTRRMLSSIRPLCLVCTPSTSRQLWTRCCVINESRINSSKALRSCRKINDCSVMPIGRRKDAKKQELQIVISIIIIETQSLNYRVDQPF